MLGPLFPATEVDARAMEVTKTIRDYVETLRA